jgi:hypothetical protein
MIDIIENRDIATADILGAFMHSDMEGGNIHMMLESTMAELLAKLDPHMYQKYVKMVNRKTVIYIKLSKALYGTLQAAYLFWMNLATCLEE